MKESQKVFVPNRITASPARTSDSYRCPKADGSLFQFAEPHPATIAPNKEPTERTGRSLFFILLLLCLVYSGVGCASSRQALAIPPVRSESATVVVIRPSVFTGWAVPYTVALDGGDIGTLRNGQWIYAYARPGSHVLTLSSIMGVSRTNMPVELVAGSQKFFSTKTKFDFLGIEAISEQRALELISKGPTLGDMPGDIMPH